VANGAGQMVWLSRSQARFAEITEVWEAGKERGPRRSPARLTFTLARANPREP